MRPGADTRIADESARLGELAPRRTGSKPAARTRQGTKLAAPDRAVAIGGHPSLTERAARTRDPIDLACGPGFPGPPSGHAHQPSRFCGRCAIETSEPTCFVCGEKTADTMPTGWYRPRERDTTGHGAVVPDWIDNLAIPGPT